jgi:hypothetical protein
VVADTRLQTGITTKQPSEFSWQARMGKKKAAEAAFSLRQIADQ